MPNTPISHHWRIIVLIVLLIGVAGLILAWKAGYLQALDHVFSRQGVADMVDRAGAFGPLAIIALMTVAVVASPLPSAPIALAAGVAYGHIWGTVFVMLGAETGALIAFGLSRHLGRDVLVRWFGPKVDAGLLGSQNALTWAVFISRLMPFVSFDLISYAAGLSTLHFWRFALATLAGIIPASFVLAHLGETAGSGDASGMTIAVLGLGLVTGVPVLLLALRGARKPKPKGNSDT